MSQTAIKKKSRKRVYVIYDARYKTNPDRATVMETCDTLGEARRNAPDYGDDCVIVRYHLEGSALSNPVVEGDK